MRTAMLKTDTPRPIKLKNYKPSDYLIDKVYLDFSLHPRETRVRSRLTMRPNPAAKGAKRQLRLDGEKLELIEAKLDGKVLSPSDYTVTRSTLTLRDAPTKTFKLEIITQIDPEANKALSGLYRSKGVYCTQCEAEGFRRITYFLDRPDVLATYTTRVEADARDASVLLSNGNPTERGSAGDRHYAVWEDPHPKPAYLFALVAGNLTSIASDFVTASGEKVDLRIYVEPGKESRCAWAMDSLKRSMIWDEKRFGREYDLDVFNIVAVSDFNMGAMENKGLNVFNDRLILASPDTATDAIYLAIESVVAHEYFHNWTGNRITCRDWFQLCLKEGLTVFRDQEFTADERDATVGRIGDVRNLRAHQFPEDAGPLAHPARPASYIEINNFYTATVYEKGAELVRMIQTICGVNGFAKGMDLYFKRHDGDAATIEDFIVCFEQAAKIDLGQFQQWYHQAGTPELVCQTAYNAKAKTFELAIEQVLPPTPGEARKKTLHIPLRIGLLGPNGRDMPLKLANGDNVKDGLLQITKRTQKFRFANVATAPVVSLLRGFTAPVNLTIDRTDDELSFLMAHDSDLFARWQAGVDFATRIMVHLTNDRKDTATIARVDAFAEGLGLSLSNTALSPAYLAEILKMPAEADIARTIGHNVDPGAIHTARSTFCKRIATKLALQLAEIYDAHGGDGARFIPDAENAGRRALRNGALTLLSTRGNKQDKARLKVHFDNADNMTDQSHALFLLASAGGADGKAALDAFRKQWKTDHIVIDTWFSAQAAAPRGSALSDIKKLMKDPLFSMETPNKVRALIGMFSAGNPSQFNKANGTGYRFLASQALALDKINPQIAARLLNAFRSWRLLEPERRAHAEAALRTIVDKDGISNDVYEIASKMVES
jgi:aminopeptidase N